MNASARGTDAACARTASAMFVHPARRHNASSPLRSAANACGARPVRMWLRSSPSVTSRT